MTKPTFVTIITMMIGCMMLLSWRVGPLIFIVIILYPFFHLCHIHIVPASELSNAPVAIICIDITRIEDIHSRKVDVSDY